MPRTKGPVRRSQLIAPFGVGAMQVFRDGTSLLTAGLDHWYEKEDGENTNIDIAEYQIDEWRLEQELEVNHFRLPPDYRTRRPFDDEVPNTDLTIPFLRFPKWYSCPQCHLLEELPLTLRDNPKCKECASKKKTKYLIQVTFVAVCTNGHLQDFPWREWAHSSVSPTCQEPLRLISTGGATLSSQYVKCDCGVRRSLGMVTSGGGKERSTALSNELDKSGITYNCRGKRPWLGTDEGEPCNRPLQGALRGAANVYYAQMTSAIYLPRGDNHTPSELITKLEHPQISQVIKLLHNAGSEVTPDFLKSQYLELVPYSDAEISQAVSILLSGGISSIANKKSKIIEDKETSFRRSEFDVLKSGVSEETLKTQKCNLAQYDPEIAQFFSQIILVEKLRETRAFSGFSRIFPEPTQTLEARKAILRRFSPLPDKEWLPAYVVYGEGLFFVFDEAKILNWLQYQGTDINQRVQKLVQNYLRLQQERGLKAKSISAKLILIHTFSHLLMNRLTFECGYSSAALRERLYISENPKEPMAGLLIYTAAGDTEGTMGGLVRMGKQSYLEPVVRRALENANWCSADPICTEMGNRTGQGPGSCNLAACHNCALVPETACEEFNRFLDRTLVVGDMENPNLGFFKS